MCSRSYCLHVDIEQVAKIVDDSFDVGIDAGSLINGRKLLKLGFIARGHLVSNRIDRYRQSAHDRRHAIEFVAAILGSITHHEEHPFSIPNLLAGLQQHLHTDQCSVVCCCVSASLQILDGAAEIGALFIVKLTNRQVDEHFVVVTYESDLVRAVDIFNRIEK